MATRFRVTAVVMLKAVAGAALTFALLTALLVSCGRMHKQSGVGAPLAAPRQSAVGAHRDAPAPGGSRTAPTINLTDALKQIDAYPAPAGVDATLFATLKDALKRELVNERAGGKRTSSAPRGKQNAVTDLDAVSYHSGSLASVAWTEALAGDYDNDGMVGIGDLGPLARYYSQDVYSGGYDGHRLVDGDGNPEIGIGDLQAVAANYSFRIEGYQVWRGIDSGGGVVWEPSPRANTSNSAQTDFSIPRPSQVRPDSRPEYLFVDDISGISDKTSIRYKVVPFGDGAVGDESNVAPLRQPAATKHGAYGTVTSLFGGGLEGVTVTVTPGDLTAATQADGSYAVWGLDNGDYTITPTMSGYVFVPPSRTVTIQDGDARGQNFTAAPDTPTHSVSGKVTLADGTGVSNAILSLSPGGWSTRSASDGSFTLAGVFDGTYALTPALTGYAFTPPERSVAVSGADVTGMDFTAAPNVPMYGVSGRITLADGNGLAGVFVVLSPSSQSTTTDANGTYAFTGVFDGSYTIQPMLPSFAFAPEIRQVTVSGSDVTGQDFYGAPSGPVHSVSGKVITGASSLAGVVVTLSPTGFNATSGADGTYAINGVPDGIYTATPTRGGYDFTPPKRSAHVDGADVTGVDFTGYSAPAPPCAVSGKVTTESGAPLAGVLLTLTPFGKSATTDNLGAYSITNVAAGGYTLAPTKVGYTFTPQNRSVTANGHNVADQDFTAAPTLFSISGTVRLADGTPVAGVVVQAVPSGFASTTGADGKFEISNLVPSNYYITPSKDQYTFSPTTRWVKLQGADVTGEDFYAYPALTISGTVTLKSGGTLGGVYIGSSPGWQSAVTKSDGTYSLSSLYGSYYYVTPSAYGYYFTPSDRYVQMSGADQTGVDFVAAPYHKVSGTITRASGQGLRNITVTLNPGGPSSQTDFNGKYTIYSVMDGDYTLVPSKTGCSFDPSSRPVTVNGADVAGQDFTATSGLANTPWPKFRANAPNTGISGNVGAQSGTLKWKTNLGGAVRSSPTIGTDGRIYVGTDNGRVCSLDPGNGSVARSYNLSGQVVSSPTQSLGNLFYVGTTNSRFVAVDIATGTQKWSRQEYPFWWVTSSAAVTADGTVYFGGSNMHAFDSDGAQKWTYYTPGGVDSSPAVAPDGTVYAGTDAPERTLYAWNPSGSVKWKYVAGGGIDSSPAIGADGTIYFGCFDGNVYALSSSGTLKWKSSVPISRLSSPAIAPDGTVYIGGSDWYIYALNGVDGSIKWLWPTTGPIRSSPAVDGAGNVYVGNDQGWVYAITPDCHIIWSYQTGGAVESSPAIGADGTVYVGSDDGYLYAFGP